MPSIGWQRTELVIAILSIMASFSAFPTPGTAEPLAPASADPPASLSTPTASLLTDSLTLSLFPYIGGALLSSFERGGPVIVLDMQYEHRIEDQSTLAIEGLFPVTNGPNQGPIYDNPAYSDLNFYYRYYPSSEALRHFYWGPGLNFQTATYGGEPIFPTQSEFDYTYGLSLQAGWIWVPFDAWTLDLGAQISYNIDPTDGDSGLYFKSLAGALWLKTGLAWSAPKSNSAPQSMSWGISLRPFFGFTSLAMGTLNTDLRANGYQNAVSQGIECGLDAPINIGSIVITPRAYALTSNIVQYPGLDSNVYVSGFPAELGLGYLWQRGPWTFEPDIFGGAFYGIFEHHYNESFIESTYGGAWAPAVEGQVGIHYSIHNFLLGAELGYRHAIIQSWTFTRVSDLGPPASARALNLEGQSLALDFSGTSVRGSVGYQF